MTDLYQEVQTKEEESDAEQLTALMAQLEEAAAVSEDCVDRMEITHDDLLKEKEEEIKAAMQKRCPEVVATLEEIDQGYE